MRGTAESNMPRSMIERAAAAFDVEALAGMRPRPEAAGMGEPLQMPGPASITPQRDRFGRVDRDALANAGIAVPNLAAPMLAQEFRVVKRHLLDGITGATGADRDRMILVASALPGEGRTFCAVNLALSIAAERGFEVLLVDADGAGCPVLPVTELDDGLIDAIGNEAIAVEDCVVRTDIPNLSVLPAGRPRDDAADLLASDHARTVLDELTRDRLDRILILDSPPVLAASVAAELARHVGRVAMVVRADTTGEADLLDALARLSGCPDIRLLLNACTAMPGGRRFGLHRRTSRR